MYKNDLKKQTIGDISFQFTPNAGQLKLTDIRKSFHNGQIEKKVSHFGIGKATCKLKISQDIFIPFIGSSLSYGLNVIGKNVSNQHQIISSPETDRRQKKNNIIDTIENELEDIDMDINYCLSREKDVIEFPSWDNQLRGIECRVEKMGLVIYEDIVKIILNELYDLWPKWNLRARGIIVKRRLQNFKKIFIEKCITFDKYPFWRKDFSFSPMKSNIDCKTKLHFFINQDFFENVRKNLIFDWENFFENSNFKGGRSLEELVEEVDNFIMKATRITRFHWPLSICKTLLKFSQEWISWVGEDSEENINKFFNGIASLQRHLLITVIKENFQKFLKYRSSDNTSNVDTDCDEYLDDSDNELLLYNVVKQISILGDEIPRCETKLFPEMFGKIKFINCGNDVNLPLFRIRFHDIFVPFEKEYLELRNNVNIFLADNFQPDKWKTLCLNCLDYQKRLNIKGSTTFSESIMVNYISKKTMLQDKTSDMIGELRRHMDDYLSLKMKDTIDFYGNASSKLYGKSEIDQICSIAQVIEKDLPILKKKLEDVKSAFKVVLELDMANETIFLKLFNILHLPKNLTLLIELIQSILKVDQEDIEKEIVIQAKEMYDEVSALDREVHFAKRKYVNSKYYKEIDRIVKRFEDAEKRLKVIVEEFPILEKRMEVLDLPPLNIDIKKLLSRTSVFKNFANVNFKISHFYEKMMCQLVSKIEYNKYDDLFIEIKKNFETLKIDKQKYNDIVLTNVIDVVLRRMENMLNECNEVMPILKMLCSEGMRDRHFSKIFQSIDNTEITKENLTVRKLLELNLIEQVDVCEEVTEIANKELRLEETLKQMQEQWEELESSSLNNILFDSVTQSLLNEHIIKTQTIISSPFAEAIMDQLNKWLKTLFEASNILELYKACHLKWQAMEPIFVNEDIVYQMPDEWRLFQNVDSRWRLISLKIMQYKQAIKIIETNVKEDLNKILEDIKSIQNGFEKYLQTRKINYPRLFFLANTELLEMLAQYRNTKSICNFLPKMFSSIYDLTFNTRGDIIEIINENDEKLLLSRPIHASLSKSHLEKRLNELEKEMIWSLRNTLKKLIQNNGISFEKCEIILEGNLDQICLLYYRLNITQCIENGINSSKINFSIDTLQKFRSNCQKLLKINKNIWLKKKLLLQTLIVEIDEYVDICKQLIESEVYLVDHLLWKKELRYYWKNDNLFIRILHMNIIYSYEFLSISQLITPTVETKKLWRHLLYAQIQNYGGIICGPPATGKSESCKTLAALLGRHSFSFNCSEQVSKSRIEDLLTGAALSGTCLCLDEFNRLQTNTMAWFANHVVGIYQSISSKSMKYEIMNNEIVLKSNFFIAVTLNPDKIGRYPIPDNVTPAFKVIIANTPGLLTICESYLKMNEFKDYQTLSTNVIKTMNILESLLTPMKHYSFKLRIIFSIITEAVINKNNNIPEFEAVKMAMAFIIKPFLIEKDNVVFDTVLNYTFYEKMLNRKNSYKLYDDEEMNKTFTLITQSLSFTIDTKYKHKCFEIMMISRISKAILMLGCSLTGKSTLLKLASEMLNHISNKKIIIKRFNPSRFSQESIFGTFHQTFNDWNNGFLVEMLMSKLDETEELWIVFDGLLDSEWAESLNSLLDSNNKLNLANGESILLESNIKIFFETDSVEKIAASTISRCRVINTNDIVIEISSCLEAEEQYNSILSVASLLKFPNMTIKNYFYTQLQNILTVYKKFWNQSLSNTLMYEIQYIFQNLIIPKENFLKDFNLDKIIPPHPMPLNKSSNNLFDNIHLKKLNDILLKLIYGNQFIILAGTFGSGKTTFLEKFTSSLDVSLWEIYKFDITTETTATIFLDSLLQTKLFRVTKDHYTVPGNRNILIIINSLHLVNDNSRNSIWEFLRCCYDRKIIQHIDGSVCTFENVYFLAEYSAKYIDDIVEKIPQRMRRYVIPISFPNVLKLKRQETTLNSFVNQLKLFAENNTIIYNEIYFYYKYLSENQKISYRILDDYCKEYIKKENNFVIFNNENKQKVQIPLKSFKEYLLKKRKDFINLFYIIEIPITDTISRRIAFYWKTLFIHNYHSITFTSYNSWDIEIISFACYIEKINFEIIYPDATPTHWNVILMKSINIAVVEEKKVLIYIPDNIYNKETKKTILKDVKQLVNGGLPLDLFGPKSINELADSFYMRTSMKPTSEVLKNQEQLSDVDHFKATTNEWKKYKCIKELLKSNLKIRFAITDNTNGIGNLRDIQDYCIIEDWRRWTEDDLLNIGISILEESNEFSDGNSINFVQKMINIHNVIRKVDNSYSTKHFIDYCKTYCYLCKKMRIGIETLDKRYKAGIKRIIKADEQMNFLQQELLRLQPELLRTSLETSQLICVIEKETIDVENAKEVVAANEFKANTTATNAQSLKADCENELSEAIPALESAIDALQCIDQKDISMLKAMRYPPSGVRLCMEAICILLEEEPAKIHEPGKKAKLDYWVTAQKLLSDMRFLQRIKNFDKDKIPLKVIRRIRRDYLSREDLDTENIKASSVAAEGLVKWIKGIDTYLRISEIIEPKKKKLKEAELLVKTEMKLLESRRKALIEITERLQKLSDQFSQMSQRKEDLIENIKNCEIKMGRAERLLNALTTEKGKWKDKLLELKQESEVYKYNMLVGSSIMEYISNWNSNKKEEMIDKITKISGCKESFKMSMFLDPTSEYLNCNKDLINTFAIVLSSRKVPLVLDTQGGVPRNMSYMIGQKLVIIDCHDKNVSCVLKNCIIEGKILLIENVVNPVPLVIYQVCNKQLFNIKEIKMLRFNNEMIPYNDNFHLILCSNQKINQFSSEFISYLCCIEITINEEIIRSHLSEELLKVIASNQMSRKEILDKNNLDLCNKLKNIEENILMLLAKSKDLDNETSIDMLNEMKTVTLKIQENKMEIHLINDHLTQVTNSYMSVINHTIKIIKILMNLPILNKLYGRSLNFLINVFRDALINVASDIKETNNNQLRDDISKYFIQLFGMALFNPHKQIFEFVVSNLVNFDYFTSIHEFNMDKLFNEYEKFIKLTNKQNNDLFENLKKIYTFNKPVLLAYSSSISSDYLLQSLHQLSMNVNINQRCHIFSIEEIDKINWNKYYKDGEWIIIENCHLGTPQHISQLIYILKNLTNNEIKNFSEKFRLFATISNSIMTENCALLDNITVVAMDQIFNIRSFLKFCYTNKVICEIHDNAKTYIFRETLYKLCIFHYVLIERSKYGIYGWFNEFSPTFTDFVSMINLYKENMTIIKHENFESIYQNILELSYQGKMSDENDLFTFIVLAKWIFVGLNKFDNIIIENLLNFDLTSSSDVISSKFDNYHFCQSLHLSGLNKHISEVFLQHEVITHREFILKMIGKSSKVLKINDIFRRGTLKNENVEKNDFPYILEKIPSSYTLRNLLHLDHVSYCITNEINFLKTKIKESSKVFLQIQYLETILLEKGIRKIDLRRILRPISIIEGIKLDYAKKYDCSIEEIYCYGTIKEPEDKSHVLELQGCYLIGCTYDIKTQKNMYILKELSPSDNPSTPIPNIYVCLKNVSSNFLQTLSKKFLMSELVLNKKHQDNQAKIFKKMYFQLYHYDNVLNEYLPILPIMIHSNIPESHWCLRGIKLLTSSPKIF
ncbi:Dynein heavy chain at 62B [Strongyloides ratti]|uniref:Dynein heavy chain at 62B n=1 Tax=Strongyloides ratti TaxID=34506 RepID=A0A090LCG0_STRRB|nr:Dynein heavy chain at 62B [Strongyloides ratti]CEF67457.1 Dynein heavy chain at 62B [Strongyloides ratti]